MNQTFTEFFTGCHSEDEIKRRYRELCFEHHPDRGGDCATMQAVNAQYQARLRGEYRKTMDADAADERCDMDARAAEVLAVLVVLPGVIVELVGRWIWITGESFNVRDQLKAAGCLWASKKRAWYWHAPEDKMRGGRKSLEEIREKYGAQQFANRSAQFHLAA